MALGKIKADTLEHSTAGTVDTQFVVNGSAKAWAKCTNAAGLDDSFNISGGTDNGTGNYTYAFTSSMATVNYVSLTNTVYATLSASGTLTASNYQVRCYSRADSLTAIDDVNFSQIAGDLA